jgi:ATP-binding cassette subfamily F protein uup
MPPLVLLSIQDAFVTFGRTPLFEGLSFNIHEGNKICLVGKNGAGKTTLMHMITGTRELDGGKRTQLPGLSIGYLQQDVSPQSNQTVFEYIYSGLKPEKQVEEYEYMVEMMLEPFELHADDQMDMLSGGQLRRASLAHILVEEPDILLLDEPTNHLDLSAIEWLEDYLRSYRGTLLCISHDKTFLANITNKIFWLDRGNIRVCPKGFAHFDEWSEMLIDQEAREIAKREKLVAQEVAWASTGVKARRKRNVRRVEEMKIARDKLKSDKYSFNKMVSKIELEPPKASMASKIIAEFFKVGKSFDDDGREKKILEKFNLRVMKGDRIGILGKNGSGKTTFLKLLIGESKPDMGKIKLAKNLNISYFDQKREDLDLTTSLWENLCPGGGEYIDVGGKTRHVCGYLKDFLFDPKHAKDLVGTLSGGQRNRLMLAKVLANPGNCLILDEPTNDLDMDTLEMLEDILIKYDGTLFIVSHDRDFLDQTVTKILSFEGDA